MSVTKAGELLQTQDKILKTFPEVASVFGKAGRAMTATDPAPLEMFETVINLRPQSEWRPGMTMDKLIAEMDTAMQFPGVSNAWTMPIKARIDMLATGIRTPIGIKVFGKSLDEIEKLARGIEVVVKTVPVPMPSVSRAGTTWISSLTAWLWRAMALAWESCRM
jgi:Cu(I)/Ag(I) efflux system membrane protein CusA/SilA